MKAARENADQSKVRDSAVLTHLKTEQPIHTSAHASNCWTDMNNKKRESGHALSDAVRHLTLGITLNYFELPWKRSSVDTQHSWEAGSRA